jgi:transcriptional regulator with XRE-family HTH domain
LGYSSQLGDYIAVSSHFREGAYKVFRKMLTELRREKGITQTELAKLLDVPQSYVSKCELGERRVDLVETLEICRALNVDPLAFVRRLINSTESEGARRSASPRDSRYTRRQANR